MTDCSPAEVLDSVLDYPTWFPLVAAFQTTGGNLSALAVTVQQAQSSYKKGEFMTGSFLENHDQPRFPSLTQDQAVYMILSPMNHALTAS